jgi:PAS domain S-box-containing protein
VTSDAISRLVDLDREETQKQRDRAEVLGMMEVFIEALPDALIIADATGNIVYCNANAELMFGYHRSELIDRPVEKLMPASFAEHHPARREAFNRFGTTLRSQTMGIGLCLLGKRSDGQEFPVDIMLARMVHPRGIFNLASIRYSLSAGTLVADEYNGGTDGGQ